MKTPALAGNSKLTSSKRFDLNIDAGRKIKLVNNILFAGNLQLAADGLRLAEGLGLDRAKTATALIECSGASAALHQFIGQDPQAMLEMVRRYMIKDVGAAADAGRNAGVDLGTLGAVTATYQES